MTGLNQLDRRLFIGACIAIPVLAALHRVAAAPLPARPDAVPYRLTDAQWRQKLTPQQYDILRQQGTEAPFTSPLLHEKRHGVFACAGCNHPLFSSDTKFDSGTGWPSFWQPLDKDAVRIATDSSLLMSRTEVHCENCGGHLGHVFDDGPKPTGLRYCMNGAAMTFKTT